MNLVSPESIEAALREHPKWSVAEGKLVRDWEFQDFPGAMAFVQQVAALAEQANHHPDIDIRYNRVRLALISHDARGVTKRDLAMLIRLDDMFPA